MRGNGLNVAALCSKFSGTALWPAPP